MKNLFVALLLTIAVWGEEEEPREDLFLSTPEQVATLTSEPTYLIGGVVSPLSGQPVLRQTDLVINGAQSIVLSRTYIPPHIPCTFLQPGPKWAEPDKKDLYYYLHQNLQLQHEHNRVEYDKKHLYYHLFNNYKGWQFYPHLRLEFNPHSMEVRLSEPSGITVDFRLTGSITSLVSPLYAISNVVGGMPSGKYDLRNTRISYEKGGDKITVYASDGTTRIYRKKGERGKTSHLYLLEKEILSNGKVLKYYYNDKKKLRTVESLDPQEKYIYASLHLAGTPGEGACHFTSSSGLAADYTYQKRSMKWKIKGKEKGKGVCPPMLTSVSSPSYRYETLNYCDHFLLSSYSGQEKVFNIFNTEVGEYRTHKLSLPVGPNDAFTPVYELSYQPPVPGEREGTTTVKNSDGTSIVYHFSKNLLTTRIQYFDSNGALKKEKIFAWDDKNWLQFLEMRDGQENLLYRKSYEYDPFGNPTIETFTGDLTGEGNQETFITRRTFSDDGKNLLLKEETEDGKAFYFSYLPHTDLPTLKLTKDNDKIILQEFFIYDDCHNLRRTITDDGAQRVIKTYTLRPSPPFLHMPEWIEETYLESGHEKLLKKVHFIYDQQGNVAEEEVYGADGSHAYTICKTYNERGDVLTETNRLGQQATYTYDSRGRPETSLDFSHRLHTTFQHDTRGRLKAHIEKGDDGSIHATSSDYDFHDRKIQQKDTFQNVTRYAYDPVVSAITQVDFPSISSIDGDPAPVSTLSTYDPFGRPVTKTDANGNTTTYRYNAYGAPVEIIYPTGGRETFRYTKSGQLRCHTDLDGLTIYYKRDVLGRVLSKTYGQALAEEIFTYDGFNLITETDKEGNVKQFTYDGAGRKIREKFCGKVTDFSYDPLGHLETICKHNGDNTLLIHYERDLEGRILEERKTDTFGHILYKINYSYDGDGNRQTVTRYINGKEAVDAYVYDSWRRQTEHRDANGYITTKRYDENYTNTLEQKVLQTALVDPRHITRVETYDALGRIIRQETLNPQDSVIACQEFIHDPCGNLVYQRDHVYENEQFNGVQTIKYTHTPDHCIASITRGCGTKEAKATTYTYLPSGKIATKTLPDGVTLTYSYHPLGFMSRVDSSDGKIHHAFTYDKLGHLTYALDEKYNIGIKREVDPFGNVIQELFPHGFEVQKSYDALHRLTALKMDQEGAVLYAYDPLYLRQVTRTSPNDSSLYSHIYEEYDLDGNLVSERLIGDLGQVIHATDPKGLKTSISSPYFSQECSYDTVGNLITLNGSHYSYDGLSQLSAEPSFTYAHDSVYNRTQKNGCPNSLNALNENTTYSYDLNGNQILSDTCRFTYDPLNRLIEASSEKHKVIFTYDPLGRRLTKTVHTSEETMSEYYLYHGQHEIGAFAAPGHPKNLRVLGPASTISIELEDQTFASLIDVQGNIRRLIDTTSRALTHTYDFTAFGEASTKESLFNPWRFASKRFDSELNLIYFGKRYYDPELARWTTTDPAGLIDSVNPYQYVFNNPFRYVDREGQFVQVVVAIPLLIWGTSAFIPALSAIVAPVIYGAITATVAYGGYKIVSALNARVDTYSPADDYAEYSMRFDAACEEEERKKYNTNPFAGAVTEDVVAVDGAGNAIKVPPGNWLTGTQDGKWIQEMKPGGGPKGEPTGQRKDGGGHPPPKHTDIRANEPHAHVPGVTNPDGTEWLPLKK